MGLAAELFFLATFSLLKASSADHHVASSRSSSPHDCIVNSKSTVSDTCISFATVNSVNRDIAPVLDSLTRDTDFFAYYRLNLFNKQCPFWSDDSAMCGNIACAVSTLDSEDDIPPIWRAEALSKLEGPKARHPGKQQRRERPKEKPLEGMLGEDVGESCVVEYDDECDERDYCVPEDEGALAKGDYVSLVNNPERFTGYSGQGAWQVWDAIYRENCFLKPPEQSVSSPSGLTFGGLKAAHDFRNVLEKHGREQVGNAAARKDGYPVDNECLEKRVFHRLISGMHASISTHLCWDYFNRTTGEWLPNLQCYKERLHKHPERISNVYFNFALLSRAVAKLQGYLDNFSFCLNDPEHNFETKQRFNQLTDTLASEPRIFDESIMFQDHDGVDLKEDFRNRFRNVSRIMDCIGCDKCRLWGKLQTAGYGAALKVLFELGDSGSNHDSLLRRTELVALVNTLGRVSHSVAAIQKFESAIDSGAEILTVHATASPAQQKASGRATTSATPKRRDGADQGNERNQRNSNPGIKDTIAEEWRLIWQAYFYFLRCWLHFPKMAYEIFLAELGRGWNFWLGRPVAPRSWGFTFPSRDEL